MAITIPTQAEKCKGAMVATAIGDALGWPNELRAKNTVKNSKINDYFVEWTRRCGRPNWHYEQILPGEYSDDTQMTLSVARSIIAGNWEEVFIKKELPFWLGYERGGGRALLKAADSCKKGIVSWQSNYSKDYFDAGGNGVVMRILPHVIAAVHSTDVNMLMTNIIKDSIITHGHPRAILGATCYAFALDYLLRKETVLEYGQLVYEVMDGQNIWGAFPNLEAFAVWSDVANRQSGFDYVREWDATLSHMMSQLEFIKTSLKKGLMLDDNNVLTQLDCFSKANGAGDVAILAAIYLASRYANNPALGIKVPAFSFGADTDTIASITGGLLGMLCGTDWIPTEWKIVQDYDCLVRITELLLSENRKEAARTAVAGVKEQIGGWESTPIGLMRRLDTFSIKSGKSTTVVITKWQSSLGQTMYFKEYRRNEPASLQIEKQMQQQLSLHDIVTQPRPNPELQPSVQIQTTSPVQAPVQKITSLQNSQRQFILNSDSIATLLENPQFKKNITIGKVLRIAQALIADNKTTETIAKQFEIELAMVTLIKNYVKD